MVGAGAGGPIQGPAKQEACAASLSGEVQRAYTELQRLASAGPAFSSPQTVERVDSILAGLVAFQEAGEKVFGRRNWDRLGEHRQGEFQRALVRHLRSGIVSAVQDGGGRLPELQRVGEEGGSGDNGSTLAFWLDRDGPREPFILETGSKADGSCGIADLLGAGEKLSDELEERVDDLRDDYSFEYMIAELGQYGYVVLEDFEDSPAGTLPRRWSWKDKDDDRNKPYLVSEEGGNHYLEATDEGESVILGREIRWNLNRYPLVSFRVRVNRIPEGADERTDDKVDSAAVIYFTINKRFLGTIPESVKYVWSSTLPVGMAALRDGIGRPWQVVFGSGKEGLGEWRTYTFDLRQAYRDTFGGNPPSKPLGIGILSDANSMGSQAYADYDDIRALKDPPPGVTVTSGVFETFRAR
jgi:hypothetical protein